MPSANDDCKTVQLRIDPVYCAARAEIEGRAGAERAEGEAEVEWVWEEGKAREGREEPCLVSLA